MTEPAPSRSESAATTAGLRPLRRQRAGCWRSRDGRFEFVGGDAIERGGDGTWWDSYEVGCDRPVYFDRSATLTDAVARIGRDYYQPRPPLSHTSPRGAA